jgi:HlyD family secretion protein
LAGGWYNRRVADHTLSSGNQLTIPELTSRARLRRNLGIVLVLVAAGAAAWYYTRPAPQGESFRTVAVARRTIVKQVEAAGRLDVQRRVEVPAPLPGRLLSIHVKEGDLVQAGQLLATLDQRASELSVKSAEAAAAAAAGSAAEASAALAAAERGLARAKDLVARGFATTQQVADAESELARAKAISASARAEQRAVGQQVESARLQKSFGRIDSPVAGVVLRAPERVGAAVAPEQGALFVIGDPLATMRVDASLSETDVPFVKPEMPASVVIVALPGRSFSAKVQHIGIEPKLEGGAPLYPVRLIVENPDGTLLPGMSARVRVEVQRQEDALAVHEAALRFVPDGADAAEPRSRVWVRMGRDRLEAVAVKAGISDGTYTAVVPQDPKALPVGTPLAVGYVQVDAGSRGPSVKLGGKK